MIFKFDVIFVLFLLLVATTCVYAEPDYTYDVKLVGVVDERLAHLLASESRLISLIDQPPPTAASLQRRIDDDVQTLLNVLQSKAYYLPSITPKVDRLTCPILIQLIIETGPLYSISAFDITFSENSDKCLQTDHSISLQDLGIEIGAKAYPKTIIEAEENLLYILEKRGYPLAKLNTREVIADILTETIAVNLSLNCGPQAFFGKTDIVGNDTLLPVFFSRKIAWHEGEVYHPELIERTLNVLELSGLFSSINITHADSLEEDRYLQMQIVIKEAKQRSVGFGVGYATDLGFGLNAEWEHRNLSRTGDKLSLVANLWQIKQEGFIRYIQPDFLRPRQDLIWAAEVEQEDVKAFREASFSLSSTIERQVDDHLRISGGVVFTRLRTTHSANNRTFSLIKVPLQLFWNRSNRLMDPTDGFTLHLKTTPSIQVQAPHFAYATHLLTMTTYCPLDEEHRFVLAGKVTLGSIWGASEHAIPPSERFYAGSDTLLRGYHYLTVSPLNRFNKPIGGRSLMVYSLEARMRVKDPFAFILFYDVGNVHSESLPQFGRKQLQSAGIGLRYHTPVGPLRLDVALPLNPRKHLDRGFEVYFSIGQSF